MSSYGPTDGSYWMASGSWEFVGAGIESCSSLWQGKKKRSGVEVGYVGTDARGPRANKVGLDIGETTEKKLS